MTITVILQDVVTGVNLLLARIALDAIVAAVVDSGRNNWGWHALD